jgi:phospholipid/cholesterol/gamma-HCH transport system substrate-binding protein
MEMEFTRLERLVGTFIIGVLMMLIATLVIIGRGKDWFETYIPYFTAFNESYNLQSDAAVKLFKADIGKVRQIVLEKNRVRVKLVILEKYASRIRQDTIAVVESPTLIGSEYISITPGSADSPMIPAGGEIPSREKRSLTDVLTDFDIDKTATLVITTIQDLSRLAETLSAPDGPLLTSMRNIESMSNHLEQVALDLQSGKGLFGAFLKSEQMLTQIEGNLASINQTLGYIHSAAEKAPATMELVQENLTTFRNSSRTISQSIDQTREVMDNIKAATIDLRSILENIKTGSQHVPRISTTFRDGIEEIREGVEQIDRVVDALQESLLIRGNLPPELPARPTDAESRP